MKLFAGIDPGASGGIAFIPEHGDAWACKMPQTDAELAETLGSLRGCTDYTMFAMLEQVHSMPGQGVASSFKFGEGYGKLQMVLTCTGIPYERVTPQKWQKAMSCLTKGDKNVSKARAQELFPHIKVTHAIADALLIAEYSRRKFNGII